ncbi:MAG: tetratricopeptide repeat protein [Candidatus Cloacimonetes bacterium]|nr:tetratricopeptide repeat protein [Candidatus Cloacimonadota bacterium]
MRNNSLQDKLWRWCNWYAYKYYQTGNLKKTLQFFEISLKIIRELNDLEAIAGMLGNFGNIYTKLGNFSKAINILQESIGIQKSIENFLGLARSYNHLAELYFKSGNLEHSLVLLYEVKNEYKYL